MNKKKEIDKLARLTILSQLRQFEVERTERFG